MTFWKKIAAMALSASIALTPALAEARAGSSSSGSRSGISSFSGGSSSQQSIGSRGSRTNDSTTGAAPIQRSMTTLPPATPSSAPSPGLGMPGYGGYGAPSFFQSHPFLSGIAGGFIGSGIAGMLFGHGGYGGGYGPGGVSYEPSGFGSMLGFLFQMALLFFVGRWLYGVFFRNSATNPSGTGFAPPYMVQGGAGSMQALPDHGTDTSVTQADKEDFAKLLGGIQESWSRSDLTTLRRLVTPEMLSYFSEELSGNTSRGVENHVEQLQFLDGDVTEAWNEDDYEYATARMTWKALDYTVSVDDPTKVTEGSRTEPAEVSEVWTFVRRSGGHWILSAIQQMLG